MNATEAYKEFFEAGRLLEIYHDKIKAKGTPGVDGIDTNRFEKDIANNIVTILRKVKNCSYNFAPYKTILVSKGPHKAPRKIAKPILRDKLVLRTLYGILDELYLPELRERALHSQVKRTIDSYQSRKHLHVLRFDIKNYFPSINHTLLLRKLKKRIRRRELVELIQAVLQAPFDIDKASGSPRGLRGVPQGLSVATILANIYLFDFDKLALSTINGDYFRYVDDILVFCSPNDASSIVDFVRNEMAKLDLQVHTEDKFENSNIDAYFEYLGYAFYNKVVTVREGSYRRIIDSMIKILTSYSDKRADQRRRAMFRLNLRTSGCIFGGKKYGWLFFFSQIEDERLLHSLDHVISKQLRRHGIHRRLVKTFVRTWYEIRFNFHNSTYIPNFDRYSEEQKVEVVGMFYRNYVPSDDLDLVFERAISGEVNRLEKDMSGMS